MIQLRPRQEKSIEDLRAAFKAGYKAPLLRASTGYGKTAVSIYMIQSAIAKGQRVWFLAHLKELLIDTASRLEAAGIAYGDIRAGMPTNRMAQVQVVSVQTAVRRLDRLEKPSLIIVDECVRGDSKIITELGEIRIDDVPRLKPNFVLSSDGAGTQFSRIIGFKSSGVKQTLRVEIGGREIYCTSNHPFYTKEGWVKACDLKVGSEVIALAGVEASRKKMSTVDRTHTLKGTGRKLLNQKKTGMDCLKQFLQDGLSAHAVAESLQILCSIALQECSNPMPTHQGTSSLLEATRKGRQGGRNFLSKKEWLYLGRCLAILRSCIRIQKQNTQGSRQTMAHLKLHGQSTKQSFLNRSTYKLRSARILGMEKSLYGQHQAASLTWRKSTASLTRMGGKKLLGSGLNKLVQSGLLGGTVMTEVFADTAFCTPKDSQAARMKSLRNGLMKNLMELLCRVQESIKSSDLEKLHPQDSLNASKATSQNSFATNWVQVAGIKEDSSYNVYDIEVERTHCFFANGLLVHNCHLAVAKTYQDIFEWCNAGPKFYKPGGAHMILLTATPCRLSGEPMGEVADLIVETCSTQELIDENLLAPIRYYAPPGPDLSKVRTTAGEFNAGDLADAMDKPSITGSAVAEYRKVAHNRPAVAFCVNIKHAENVAQEFREAGYRAVAVSGESDSVERDAALRGLRDGQLDIVCNCALWVAGVDAPSIACIIMLAPTQSLTKYLQSIGRGLRMHPGKDCCVVLDHAGNLARHGDPTMPRTWSLLGGDKKKSEKQELPVRVCPSCFSVVAASATDCACGHHFAPKERELNHVDGELKEISLGGAGQYAAAESAVKFKTEAEMLRIFKARGTKRPELRARAAFKAQFVSLSRQLGMAGAQKFLQEHGR